MMLTERPGQSKNYSLIQTLVLVFPTRVYPNPIPDTRFWLFSTTRNPFFQPANPDILKKTRIAVHSNISNSDNTEVEEWRVQWPN